MGAWQAVKGWFGRNAEPKVKNFTDKNIRVNSLVELDTTPFIINDDYLVMVNPGERQQVEAIGELALFEEKYTRVYVKGDEGESFIQISNDNGEMILFRQIDQIHPQRVDEWNQWYNPHVNSGMMVNDTFRIQDGQVTFNAVWNNVVTFDEYIHERDNESYNQPTSCTLYEREVVLENGDKITEYLLVAIEEEERVCLYVGIEINSAGVKFN